jgi:outer membrane receptor for ferrienterochelin and colicins
MRLLITFFGLFFSSELIGQERSDTMGLRTMDEVVVTATRTPRLMGNLAIPVSLVAAKTIYQSGSLRLHDILAEQTGINIIENFGKGIQVQGLSSEYTLILIDGEPLIGRTGGVLDLSRISVRNIRKIEIVKGPSSSLYGSEAMGGVVNIITDRSGQNITDASIRYGRFNTLDGGINFSRRLGKTDLQASLNHNRSSGYSLRPNSLQPTVEPFWRSVQQLNIGHQLSEKWKIGTSLRKNFSKINNSIVVQNQGVSILSKGFETNDEYNINPYLQFQASPKLKTVIRGYLTGFQASQELSIKDVAGNYNDQFRQTFHRIENQTDWQIRKSSAFTAGAGNIVETVASNRYDSSSTQRSNNIAYFFLQHEEMFSQRFMLVAGFRYDANKAYASIGSPKLAIQYRYNENLSFNFSYGRGFKAPDFRQLYLNFTNLAAGAYSVFGSEVAAGELNRLQQNGLIEQTTSLASGLSALRPEISGGWNGGLKYKNDKLITLSLNLFRNDLRNMIVTDIIAIKKNGGQIYSYFNLKEAFTQGLEFNADKHFNQFSIRAGYQFLYTGDKEVIDAIKTGSVFARNRISGLAERMKLSEYGGLANRSRHTANLKLSYENKNERFLTLRAIYRSRWGTFDADGNGLINRDDEYASGYVQFNFSCGMPIGKRLKCAAGVDNIFNYKDTIYLPGNPGRSAYMDLKITF